MYFSATYTTARDRFRETVHQAGGRLDSLPISSRGPAGEELTVDLGWFGATEPRRVFVHSSGLHGVEGFAGSAIQLHWLRGGIRAIPVDAAILIVHVLNPYGMAWLRRVNENNVDLNRNFLATGKDYAGSPPGYAELDAFLNPVTLPSPDLFYLQAGWLVLGHGLNTLQMAASGGQYVNPKGLFFGGERMEASTAAFQEYLKTHLGGVERVVAIDVHTGLGKFGEDRLLIDVSLLPAAACSAMRSAFGDCVQPAGRLRGAQEGMYFRLFPRAEVYFASHEFGTYHPLVVVKALRAENCRRDYASRIRLLKVFCPRSERWRKTLLRRGGEVMAQAQMLLNTGA